MKFKICLYFYSIISTVKLHSSSVWNNLCKFFKKSLRVAEIILHSYPLVSDWSSPQCEFTIDFLTKSIKVGTKKCLLFGVCPKLTAYSPMPIQGVLKHFVENFKLQFLNLSNLQGHARSAENHITDDPPFFTKEDRLIQQQKIS